MSNDETEYGEITRLNSARGYGFIRCDMEVPALLGRDLFFHFSNADKADKYQLTVGDRVAFIITTAREPGKLAAYGVRRATTEKDQTDG